MEEHALGDGGGAEGLGAVEGGVVGHADVGHGGGAAGDEGEAVFLSEGEQALDEGLAGASEFLRDVVAGNDVEAGEGRGHGCGVVPVTAGEEDAAGGGFVCRAANAGGNRVAVGDGFAVDGEVWLIAINGVGSIDRQPEAAADVVQDLQCAVFATEAVASGDKLGGGEL